MRLFTLSPRLKALADQVPPGSLLADIGTDHAMLPVWLLCRGVIERAVATDLRESPLKSARENARRFGVEEKISFRLGDGLQVLNSDEADVIVIAGMGGDTIAAILEAAPWALGGEHLFLLQPMSSVHELRSRLQNHRFDILSESLCTDAGRRYVSMAVRAGASTARLTPGEIWVGRQRRDREEPLRSAYLAGERNRAEKALAGIAFSGKPEDAARREELKAVAADLERLEKEWLSWQP